MSELATNALCHGNGVLTLRARLSESRLLMDVLDEGGGFEHDPWRMDFEHVGGWGMDIVANLSSRWGVHDGTVQVWAELELSGPEGSEPGDAHHSASAAP